MTTGRDLERLARGRHIAQIRAVFNLLKRGAPEHDHQALDDARLMIEDSAHHAFRDLTRHDRPATQIEHQE